LDGEAGARDGAEIAHIGGDGLDAGACARDGAGVGVGDGKRAGVAEADGAARQKYGIGAGLAGAGRGALLRLCGRARPQRRQRDCRAERGNPWQAAQGAVGTLRQRKAPIPQFSGSIYPRLAPGHRGRSQTAISGLVRRCKLHSYSITRVHSTASLIQVKGVFQISRLYAKDLSLG